MISLSKTDAKEDDDSKFRELIESVMPRTYTGRYGMHRYWARKPANIVAEFIRHYSKPAEVILDPFCGSGVTGVESLILKRKAICIDINPMAILITRMTATRVDLRTFELAFDRVKAEVAPSLEVLYRTICDKCGEQATMTSLIWVGDLPTRMRYSCSNCGRGVRDPTSLDRQHISKLEEVEVPYWFPTARLFENTRINAHKGTTVADLFSRRSLIALATIFHSIDSLPESTEKELMKFTFTAALSQASKMVFVVRRRGRQAGEIKETEGVGSRVIGYWMPKEHFEINAWNCFENRFRRVLAGKQETQRLIDDATEARSFDDLKDEATFWALNQSATDLRRIPDDSVDYIFTDPPFGDQVPHLELDALWSAWLRFRVNYEDEIVISNSPERAKSFDDYSTRLTAALRECRRVLKTNRYMSVAFHNYDLRVWHTLVSACAEIGFQIVNVLPINNSHPSIVQLYREGGTKGALVVTFRSGPQLEFEPTPPNIENILIESISRTIEMLGGTAPTSRVYDTILSTLIRHNSLDKEEAVERVLQERFEFWNGKWQRKRAQSSGNE